jgi:hypothetical protein
MPHRPDLAEVGPHYCRPDAQPIERSIDTRSDYRESQDGRLTGQPRFPVK